MSDVSVHDAIFTTRAMRRVKPDPIPESGLMNRKSTDCSNLFIRLETKGLAWDSPSIARSYAPMAVRFGLPPTPTGAQPSV